MMANFIVSDCETVVNNCTAKPLTWVLVLGRVVDGERSQQ